MSKLDELIKELCPNGWNASAGSATTASVASTGSAAGNDTAIEPVRNAVIEPVEMTDNEE